MPDPVIQPALTPDEWAAEKAVRGERDVVSVQRWDDRGGLSYSMGLTVDIQRKKSSFAIPEHAMHAVAALCLHGQPFGFDREQLVALREMMTRAELYIDEYESNPNPRWSGAAEEMQTRERRMVLAHAAIDRIAALLPPDALLPPTP